MPSHSNSQPLHAQVASSLRSEIESGLLTGPLPSEARLVERFGVSRSVIRQALETLRREALISKEHGRGSFVIPTSRIHRVAQSLNGLGMQLATRGEPVSTAVVTYKLVDWADAPSEWGAVPSLHLVRLRSLNGYPLAFIETYLPGRFAELIPEGDLVDDSLHRRLRDDAGIRLERSDRTVLAIPARDEIATQLAIPTGAPVLVLEGTTFDSDGNPVEVFTTYHRGDRLALDLTTISPENP